MGYKPPAIKDMIFYDVFSTLCDLILQESPNIAILGDYNCDFMADSPMKNIWNFWFTKSGNCTNLFQKSKLAAWLTFVWCLTQRG